MSDSQNNTTPPDKPKDPNRPSGDSNGFNWRVFALFSLAIIILGAAFFGPQLNEQATTLSYAEFRNKLDQDLMILEDSDRPLKVVTSDTAYDATITGWMKPEPVMPDEGLRETKSTDFRVPVNLDLQGEEIRELLGDNIRMEQIPDSGDAPIKGDVETLSLAQFRKSQALDEVKAGDFVNPLRILTTDGNANAVIVGKRVEVTNMIQPKDKEGKPLEASPFKVSVSSSILGGELRELLKDKAQYVRESDYLSKALFTFLPFLLIILLLFFLFRQQMKSAGRGAMSFGKSKARLLTMDKNRVTFKDVAGIQEAKEELFEISEARWLHPERRADGRFSGNW